MQCYISTEALDTLNCERTDHIQRFTVEKADNYGFQTYHVERYGDQFLFFLIRRVNGLSKDNTVYNIFAGITNTIIYIILIKCRKRQWRIKAKYKLPEKVLEKVLVIKPQMEKNNI